MNIVQKLGWKKTIVIAVCALAAYVLLVWLVAMAGQALSPNLG